MTLHRQHLVGARVDGVATSLLGRTGLEGAPGGALAAVLRSALATVETALPDQRHPVHLDCLGVRLDDPHVPIDDDQGDGHVVHDGLQQGLGLDESSGPSRQAPLQCSHAGPPMPDQDDRDHDRRDRSHGDPADMNEPGVGRGHPGAVQALPQQGGHHDGGGSERGQDPTQPGARGVPLVPWGIRERGNIDHAAGLYQLPELRRHPGAGPEIPAPPARTTKPGTIARVRLLLNVENISVVGARGFEPPTSCSRSRRATKLRYAPTGRTN